MKAKCAALLVGMLLLGATRVEATTYAVSEFNRSLALIVAVGGSITTDGTLGPIGTANIVDWNLIGSAISEDSLGNLTGTALFDLTGPLSGGNSTLNKAVNITATANALTLGQASGAIIPDGDLIFGAMDEEIEFTVDTDFAEPTSKFTVCTVIQCFVGVGGLTFADGKVIPATPTPPATPLPAALPLFATGIGGLGLLGWRRKRKAKAVA